ncbi:MAG: SseB family protein [Actinomycetota bacterium]|nr:SseB family protein [Actinomycetota bacterium]
MSDMESDSGSKLVRAAREVLAGHLSVLDMEKVFARSTVFAQRPSKPGVLVADLPGKGSWVMVFSTPERLGRYAGDCDFFVTTGADLQAQLPGGIGILLDCQDAHGVALKPP